MDNFPRIAKVATSSAGVVIAVVIAVVAVAGIAVAKPFAQGQSLSSQVHRLAIQAKADLSTADIDRDGLTNWVEVKRTRTSPHNADSDGDGLSDWTEVKRTRTSPRKADSDGDGFNDGNEIAAGTDPWNPASFPGLPPAPPPPTPPVDTTAPNTTITAAPPATTTSTSASFSFSSTESGSSFQCRLGAGAFGSCTSPKPYTNLAVGAHSFEVRATDAAGNVDSSPATRTWTVEAPSSSAVEAVWVAPVEVEADVPVTLDGTDSNGEAPLDCTWSFENQSGSVVWGTQDGCVIDFTFEESGTKYVRLIVEGPEGETDSNKQSFDVEPTSGPNPPPPDTTPPDTSITAAPPATTTSTSASLSFSSTESGSTFQCKLDGAAFASCTSPKPYTGLAVGAHSFEVRATDAAGNVEPIPATRSWTVQEPSSPPPPPPPGCAAGATQATTAAQVHSLVQAKTSVCVTANVGDVNLRSLGSRPGVVISTNGGSMGHLDVYDTTNLTIRNARFRSAELWYANGMTIENCQVGGTEGNRTTDTLVNIMASPDVTVKNSELAWTDSSDSEDIAGYGIRSPGITNANNDRLHIEGNYIHHIGADAIQGLGESVNVVIDRNRFDYVGKTPGTSEHSDIMQIYGSGPNARITNNSISHEGYYAQGQVSGSSGTLYVHNGETDALLIENNLFRDTQGTILFGVSPPENQNMANVTFRRNTVLNVGQAYGGGWTGLQWGIKTGSNNLFERNIAQSDDGGISYPYGGSASSAIYVEDLWQTGNVLTFDAEGNCTSAACNPASGPIGYRKPSGVSW